MSPIEIDGSRGEGGGQILRTALGLSAVTGKPFRIDRIRAGRPKPGLARQHLTAVRAAAEVCGAKVAGDELRSRTLEFSPGDVKGGEYRFDVGTAGSATLVLQTILPPLAVASQPSRITLIGGTHNPGGPPFEFLEATFLPLVDQTGPQIRATLVRPGFYPAGGGEMLVEIEPAERWRRLDLPRAEKRPEISAKALVAQLPLHIAERELKKIGRRLQIPAKRLQAVEVTDSRGPGNAALIELRFDRVTEIVTGFGRRGVAAERVATEAAREAETLIDSGVCVGEHLADQLLIPLSLAGGGSFYTLPPTPHLETNVATVRRFLDVSIAMSEAAPRVWLVSVSPP